MADAPASPVRLPGLAMQLAAQVRYQVRLLARTPRAIFASLALPGLLLFFRLGSHGHPGAQAAPLVAGLAVSGVLSTAYVAHASGLVTARESGILRRWRATPMPSWAYFTGRIVATVLLADLSGVVILGAGAVIAHLHVDPGAAVSLLAVISAGALAWAACGTAMTAVIATPDSAWPVLAASYLPVVLFSGVFGSASEPGWLSTLARYLPAQPIVDAGTRAVQQAGGEVPAVPGRDLAVAGGLGGRRPGGFRLLLPVGPAPGQACQAPARLGTRGRGNGPAFGAPVSGRRELIWSGVASCRRAARREARPP